MGDIGMNLNKLSPHGSPVISCVIRYLKIQDGGCFSRWPPKWHLKTCFCHRKGSCWSISLILVSISMFSNLLKLILLLIILLEQFFTVKMCFYTMSIFNLSVDIKSFVTPSSASHFLINIYSAVLEQLT